jgi:hypothetical protein
MDSEKTAMTVHGLPRYVLGVLVFGWCATRLVAVAGDEPSAQKSADERFEKLLTSAMKEPKKADWTVLRHAFSETSHYIPYNDQWREELLQVRREIARGELRAAEAALVKLLERERFMRLDAQTLAVMVYDRTGQKGKSQHHREFMAGLAGAVFVPGHGVSVEKPIEVLFIDEEYIVLGGLGARLKSQSLVGHNGHHLDVLTVEAKGNQPERKLYFNIDMPFGALEKNLQRDLDRAKKPARKSA